MVLPRMSGRWARMRAAWAAAPEDTPANTPSVRTSYRAAA